MPSQITTPGKILLKDIIPSDIDIEGVVEKDNLDKLFQELAVKHPEDYVDILDKLNRVALNAATRYGDTTSISLSDLDLPPRLKEYRKRLQERVNKIAQDSRLSAAQKNERMVKLMTKVADEVRTKVMTEGEKTGNKFVFTGTHGFRGNPVQLTQLLFGDLIMADHKGRPVPIPGLHGYGEGVTPAEFWAGTYGSRAGYAGVQLNTQESGYFTKQLAMLPHRVKITGNDCGAKEVGISVDPENPDIIGHVLAESVAGLPANKIITAKDLPKLKDRDDVLVRSLLTCQQPEGVCQKCAGVRETGRYPSIGEHIGVESARLVGEPLTQAALSSKHVGGIVGKTDTQARGFNAVQQVFAVPKNFKGKAVLAPVDGSITQITKAPQGGQYVMVGTEQVFVPEDRELQVQKGDKVEPGDVLSSGLVNPSEIAEYKGIGAGREYFLKQFHEMLKENGVKVHMRNLEPIVREFFNRVEITSPEGYDMYGPGDVVPYSDIQRIYKSRPDAYVKDVKYAKGKYLEKPVLEYSIGTKVTPAVVRRLKAKGINKALVNDNPPPFKAKVVRLEDVLKTDPDFKAKMGAWGIKKSFLESAQQGGESPHKNTSYIPSLMDSTKL